MPEFLLDEKNKRSTYDKPVCRDIHDHLDKMDRSFWLAHDIKWNKKDREDHANLSKEKRAALRYVNGLFWKLDIVVMKNIAKHLLSIVQVNEVEKMLISQLHTEAVHDTTYNDCIHHLYSEEERGQIKTEITACEIVQEIGTWIQTCYTRDLSLAELLVLGICIEGLFFSPLFAFVAWMTQGDKIDSLREANHTIRRDEGMHCEGYALLYRYVDARCASDRVYKLIDDAVTLASRFAQKFLAEPFSGMNAELMGAYIRCNADYYLNMLGYDVVYRTKNPFTFMEFISTDEKSNFHERVPLEYTRPSSKKKQGKDDQWLDSMIEGME